MDTNKQQVEKTRSPTADTRAALAEIYNQQVPENLSSYQNGVKAGIRYALLAVGEKIEGINCGKEGGGHSE